MSYSISSGIQELEEKLESERAIAKRFPDAILEKRVDGSQVWMAESAKGQTTDIELIPSSPAKDRSYPSHEILIYSYLTVEKMRVYAREYIPTAHYVWLETLKTRHPDIYKALVAASVTQR